jgi:hypothetical protein
MLELGDTALSVKYGELRKDPIHVESLTLNQPRLVIEQSNGAINFRKAMDLMPAHAHESSSQPIKLIIDELKVLDAQVVIHPGLPGVREEIIVPVPSMESGALPAELKALLHLNVGAVAAKLGAEAQKQIAAAIPGELGNKLSKVVEDPQALAKDPAKVLQRDVSGILGGDKTTQPAAAGRAAAPRKP